MIRKVQAEDADAVARIYNHYIVKTVATFEETPVSAEDMRERAAQTSEGYPWLVFESEGRVLGYAYGRKWHERGAYRHSVEIGIYLDPKHLGNGLGSRLYERLLADLKGCGFHTAIGGVALPNAASVALLEKFGFVKAAHYREVGRKLGRWIDVGYWQKILT